MVTLTCPDCGSDHDLPVLDRTAECFCDECDYPLFWAPAAGALGYSEGEESDDALRRLPGTGGRTLLVSLACPDCGERNPASGMNCTRCSVLLRPVPVVVTEPEPVIEPVVIAPPPPPPPARPFPWFWVLLGAGLIFVTILVLVLSLA